MMSNQYDRLSPEPSALLKTFPEQCFWHNIGNFFKKKYVTIPTTGYIHFYVGRPEPGTQVQSSVQHTMPDLCAEALSRHKGHLWTPTKAPPQVRQDFILNLNCEEHNINVGSSHMLLICTDSASPANGSYHTECPIGAIQKSPRLGAWKVAKIDLTSAICYQCTKVHVSSLHLQPRNRARMSPWLHFHPPCNTLAIHDVVILLKK